MDDFAMLNKSDHNLKIGTNTIIGDNFRYGRNVVIQNNCVIEDNVFLGDNVFIDHNCVIRNDVSIGDDSSIGSGSILGEYQMDFYADRSYHKHPLMIGKKAIIRSNTIIYSGSVIGDSFQSGHHVTIREKSAIGNHVSVGTLSDIQGHCKIGNYVRMHSNVHIGTSSVIDDCCWIYPYVVLTNDPTPPSNSEHGVHVHPFAIIATNAIILPGVSVHSDSLVGAGALVNRDVGQYQVVVGNPGKVKCDLREIKNKDTGEPYYPWRYHFERNMPWEDYGFDNWYSKLDDEMKSLLIIS